MLTIWFHFLKSPSSLLFTQPHCKQCPRSRAWPWTLNKSELSLGVKAVHGQDSWQGICFPPISNGPLSGPRPHALPVTSQRAPGHPPRAKAHPGVSSVPGRQNCQVLALQLQALSSPQKQFRLSFSWPEPNHRGTAQAQPHSWRGNVGCWG